MGGRAVYRIGWGVVSGLLRGLGWRSVYTVYRVGCGAGSGLACVLVGEVFLGGRSVCLVRWYLGGGSVLRACSVCLVWVTVYKLGFGVVQVGEGSLDGRSVCLVWWSLGGGSVLRGCSVCLMGVV